MSSKSQFPARRLSIGLSFGSGPTYWQNVQLQRFALRGREVASKVYLMKPQWQLPLMLFFSGGVASSCFCCFELCSMSSSAARFLLSPSLAIITDLITIK